MLVDHSSLLLAYWDVAMTTSQPFMILCIDYSKVDVTKIKVQIVDERREG